MREAAADALTTMAEDLAARAVADAPVDTGTLRASVSPGPGGELVMREQPRSNGERIEVEVSFSTPYAAVQHEGHALMHHKVNVYERTGPRGGWKKVGQKLVEYTWRARRWPGGGGPKFLERNVTAQAPRYERILKAAVERAFRG